MNATLLVLTAIMSALRNSEEALGGWKEEKVDADSEGRLVSVLSAQTETTAPRICVNKVILVKKQVVAGMNYQYTIEGCDQESKSGMQKCVNCVNRKTYDVVIYERLGENVKELISFEEVKSESKPDSIQNSDDASRELGTNEITEEEKAQITGWISQKKLNRYGDERGTSYTGGNPLFDENKGKAIDYYEYMLGRFPTRPWKEMAVHLQSNVTNGGLQLMAEDKKQSTRTIVLLTSFVVAVLVAMAAMVIFVRLQRNQRRHTYESISDSVHN
uniref:AlNc14C202G8728 protein n=1 Tax=Albugo laibachii Nc14 TaxID=890382 RepID=F0WQR8_9STRA|nr:AlNc14C202G8728 [Albugo laibachii Nc14]CCA25338.1 AlNc14C291G10244 [Albugo laibachii Nc14]|eukprot:CCA25338.1 AlNc14C291G10244 [Albugo laibachii Nc14]